MQLIKPRQISGEIMTLIEEADERVILITPYFKVRNWYKLLNVMRSLSQRRIQVELYIRKGEIDSFNEAMDIGIKPFEIPNLHTKLYLNEKVGIVSSMNILHSSDTNSLDIALKTENPKEYRELIEYYERYIAQAHAAFAGGDSALSAVTLSGAGTDWRSDLVARLEQALRFRVYSEEQFNKLTLQANNRYEITIQAGDENSMRIVGILSGKEYDYAIKNPATYSKMGIRTELQQGENGRYDTITGIQSGLKSHQISDPLPQEIQTIVEAIVKFIVGIEQLKQASYSSKVSL